MKKNEPCYGLTPFRANQVNPFDYLLAVVRNTEAAKTDPGRWLPWNYRKNLEPPSALSG